MFLLEHGLAAPASRLEIRWVRLRERAQPTQQTPSQTAARPPPGGGDASPELGLLVQKQITRTATSTAKCVAPGVCFFCLFDTENGMHGDGPRKASPMRHLRSKIR